MFKSKLEYTMSTYVKCILIMFNYNIFKCYERNRKMDKK